jgi:multisubunit Na+/H+ antiporter MnhE subunit
MTALPRGVRFLVWWLGSALLWLVLASTLARPEVVAGLAAGLITALLALRRETLGLELYRVRVRWLRHLPRLAVQVLKDLVILGRVLLHPRRVTSPFRALPFDVDSGREATGRRALLALAASLGPNTFVLGFDKERQLVLVHQLVANEQVLPIPDGKYPPP